MGRPAKTRNAGAVARAPWDTSCLDWQARVRDRRSLLPDLPLHREEARDALRIFSMLRLPDVPGTPTLGEACGPWFKDVIAALFGAFDPATGIRHLHEVFVLVPKKNSKTTYCAALMLVAMFMSRRPRAEFLFVAPTHEVAELAYKQAVGMILLDPVLTAKCHVQEHIQRIARRDTGAFLKIKSFDTRVVTGSKPAGVLLDEVHVIAQSTNADRVVGQLRGGLISQPEGFMVQISTQSERVPAGVFKTELQKARDVRDGRLVSPILPLLYEFPPTVAWRDPANWPMVLPNLGRSVMQERLEVEYRAADNAGPEELRRWASQHLNIEIGMALLSDAWAGADFWLTQADAALTLDALLQRSTVVVVGIDGGGNDDLYGLTLLGKERGTGDLLSWSRAWALPIVLERRKEIAPRLRDFERDGDLVIVPRIEDACAEVVALIQRIDAAGLLGTFDDGKRKAIGVDPAGIKQTLDALNAANYPDDSICAVSQGWRLGSAIKSCELYLSSGALRHAEQPLMTWCVSNAKVEAKGNAVLITKQASGSAKIDPLMAAFNAVELMARNPVTAPEFQVFFAG